LFWIENLNIHIQQAMNGAPLTDYDNYNAHNAEDYPRKKHLSWPEMLNLLKTTFNTLSRLIQEFPINESDLTREEWEKWTGGRTLQRAVLGSTISHSVYHFTQFFLDHNRVADMEAIVQTAADMLTPYEPVQATIYYNVACYYALHDQAEKAVPLLRDSFTKNASLRDWSQQDTDLDSLRTHPDYLALLVSQPES
jgi:hypothetical protein